VSNPRIIAGKARGRRLEMVPGDITRPITDRVKEALFNIFGADILDASLLDLFGGTGSVGLEALSRGANFVRLVDLNRPAIETIKANLEQTGLKAGAEVVRADALALVRQPADRRFDYIFIAPPQYKEMWREVILSLDANPSWLAQGGWIIAQIDPLEYAPLPLRRYVEFDQRRYGSTLLVFYEEKTAEAAPRRHKKNAPRTALRHPAAIVPVEELDISLRPAAVHSTCGWAPIPTRPRLIQPAIRRTIPPSG
jgi:16S rRNA (guanine(966)-N(2))-methyltransferase RsmD